MNIKKHILALALILMAAVPAFAQFKIGPRIGVNVNSLHFDKETFQAENRTGFTGGVQAELMIPVVNLGIDASVMYVKRSSAWGDFHTESVHSEYIEIPINLKYKLGLPIVGSFLKPYVFTGPSFAFLTSKKIVSDVIHNKKNSTAWNLGFGLELINHLQIGASYSIGLSKSVEVDEPLDGGSRAHESVYGKNRYWTITAAWLF